jgi:hypothetical protein
MFVRSEMLRFKKRFRDLLLVSALVAGLAGSFIALINNSFVSIWTSEQVFWSPWNNFLLACLLFVSTIIRCNVDLTIITQEIGIIRYARLIEGAFFISISLFVVTDFGFAGILFVALCCNIFVTGLISFGKTARFFKISMLEAISGINYTPLLLILTVVICAVIFNSPFSELYIYLQVFIQISLFLFIIIPFALFFSIDRMLRFEAKTVFSSALSSLSNVIWPRKPLKPWGKF